ncbi:hypothetical protein AMECASPLE_018435 [Ameca splendens]|uniref:Uncharacterized protein n=1 Tax=Ameca splendens TaxID=208324 RepID=A0ABV0ZC05_9TELE
MEGVSLLFLQAQSDHSGDCVLDSSSLLCVSCSSKLLEQFPASPAPSASPIQIQPVARETISPPRPERFSGNLKKCNKPK